MSDSQTASYEVLAPGGHANLISDIKEYVADAITVKPDFDALAPDLTSGASLALIGPTATEATWAQRETDAVDGVAMVDAILGKTVVWNQVVPAFDDTWTTNAVTTSYDQTTNTVTVTSTSDNNIIKRTSKISVAGIAGHKYYMASTVDMSHVSVSTNASIGFNSGSSNVGLLAIAKDTVGRVSGIVEATADSTAVVLRIPSNTPAGNYVTYKDAIIFDLTRMFGAGNEPSTVAEFEALFPDAYYPYDAGSLLSVNLTGVESTDTGGNVLQQRSIPAATYFPDGLRSAGTVHDELTADVAVTRVGVIDLETLPWGRAKISDEAGYRYVVAVSSILPPSTNNTKAKLLCMSYDVVTANQTGAAVEGIAFSSAGNLIIYDASKSSMTAAEFKAAMGGIVLYYALATPTHTTIDPPLNMSYRIERGGIESVMHTDPTAAPTWRIRYPFDLAAAVMANIAPVEQPIATANHAIGDLLCVGWQLYRATSAIAIGERIIAGTNVTATTVATELAAIQ